jgi:hypothetical protein
LRACGMCAHNHAHTHQIKIGWGDMNKIEVVLEPFRRQRYWLIQTCCNF